jgi:hypothetical protein
VLIAGGRNSSYFFFAERPRAVFRPPLRDDFRDGTFAPFARASLSPMAIACLRLVTRRPDPLFNVPFFFRRIADSTVFDAAFPYFAIGTSPSSYSFEIATARSREWRHAARHWSYRTGGQVPVASRTDVTSSSRDAAASRILCAPVIRLLLNAAGHRYLLWCRRHGTGLTLWRRRLLCAERGHSHCQNGCDHGDIVATDLALMGPPVFVGSIGVLRLQRACQSAPHRDELRQEPARCAGLANGCRRAPRQLDQGLLPAVRA